MLVAMSRRGRTRSGHGSIASSAWLDPFTRPVWRRFGIGNVVEVVIPGRHTGRPRTLFLGLLRGMAGPTSVIPTATARGRETWMRRAAARSCSTTAPAAVPGGCPLPAGDEREAVIRLTFRQHPFPGMLLYWLSRDHVRATADYRLLDMATDAAGGFANRRDGVRTARRPPADSSSWT